jgi:hypothetical protein
MAKILIPRSDSISVKTIEPSDFESFFSSDIVNDYVKSGFTLSAGTGLSVNIAIGIARLKGLYINNSTASSKGSLTASQTNYIYITLARDINSEAESWSFTSNTTGTTPTDSLFIGTATTDATSVTSINVLTVETFALASKTEDYFGNGSDGLLSSSGNITLTDEGNYTDLTINTGHTLTATNYLLLRVSGTLTVNGTINMDGKANTGGGAGGGGADGVNGTLGGAGSDGINPFGISSIAGDGGIGGQYGVASSGTPAGTAPSGGNGGDLTSFIEKRLTSVAFILKSLPIISGSSGGGGAGGGGSAAGTQTGNRSAGQGADGGAGGIGGGGGGTIIIVAKKIVIGAGGIISSKGVDGVDGVNGQNGGSAYNCTAHGSATGGGGGGGGAGGGGGSGGAVVLIYRELTNNGTISTSGGSGGTAGALGAGGGNCGSTNQTLGFGTSGASGTGGASGVSHSFQI